MHLNEEIKISSTTKEKLLAIQLLGMARQSVQQYSTSQNVNVYVEAVLTLAAEYAKTGADLSILKVLEYPDTTRASC